MSFTLLSGIIILAGALFVLRTTTRGYKLGFAGASVGLAMTIFSAFSAAMIASVDSGLDKSFALLLRQNGILQMFSSNTASLSAVYDYLLNIATSVIMIPVYFFVILGVSTLTVGIVKRCLKKGASDPAYSRMDAGYVEKNDKKLGAAVGAVAGLLMTVVVFTPFTALPKAADTTIKIVEEFNYNGSGTVNKNSRELIAFSDDFIGNVVYSCGGKMLFDIASTSSSDGRRSNFNDEVKIFEKIGNEHVERTLRMLSSADPSESLLALSYINNTEDSKIFDIILLVTLKESTSAWARGAEFSGMPKPNPCDNVIVQHLMDEIILLLGRSRVNTVREDIAMLVSMNALLYEKSAIYDDGDYSLQTADLFYSGSYDRICNLLLSSALTRDKSYLAENMVVGILANEFMTNDQTLGMQICAELASSVNSLYFYPLPDDIRAQETKLMLSTVFSNNGFALPDEICAILYNRMSDSFILSGNSIFTEDVASFFMSFVPNY